MVRTLDCAIVGSFLVAAFAASLLTPAAAAVPYDFDDQPAVIVSAAFGTDEGLEIIRRVAETIRVSADASCLASNGVDSAKLLTSSTEILQAVGTLNVEAWQKAVDAADYETEFAARACADAKAELAGLRADIEVQKLMDLERQLKLVNALDDTVENFARFLLVQRIRVSKEVWPRLAGGDLDPSLPDEKKAGAIADAIKRFPAENGSPQVARYAQLATMSREAADKVLQRDSMPGLATILAGVAGELTKVCLVPGAR